MAPSQPRRFAPLRLPVDAHSAAPRLRGVVFDFDGTLCEPQTYMFAQMRAVLGVAAGADILAHIDGLPTAAARAAAHEQIKTIERAAMAAQLPQPGLAALFAYLDAHALPKAICTRNFDRPVAHFLSTFLPDVALAPIVTRAFRPAKPHPAGILHIAAAWDLLGAEDLIMVGDSLDDMTAGRRAGAATVLLVNDVNAHLATHDHTDLCIRRLDELITILDEGFVGRAGDEEKAAGAEKTEEREQAEEGVMV